MLGHVLCRLPSFADRARLRAVCRAWCAAWRSQPHPPAPWLAVPGRCVSLPDGAIHSVLPLPEDARNARCIGSLGDWLALVPLALSGGGTPFLLNPFSTARIPLPPWTDYDEPICKIIMSSAPDSSCVVVAMVDCGENRRRIAACRPGEGHEGAWSPVSVALDLQDIAFYEGRLHALTSCNELVVYEPDLLCREKRRLHKEQLPLPATRTEYSESRQYLVECNGRLLKVIRYLRRKVHETVMIEVYALEPNDTWARVKGIVGRALFVGDACSGSFPAAAVASPRSEDMIRENEVCFVDYELAIRAELEKSSWSAIIGTVEQHGDLYGSVLHHLRTLQVYVFSKQWTNVYGLGLSGRWPMGRTFDSSWWHMGKNSVVI